MLNQNKKVTNPFAKVVISTYITLYNTVVHISASIWIKSTQSDDGYFQEADVPSTVNQLHEI